MTRATDGLVQRFLSHRRVTQEVLRRVPDDKADFKPWDGALTVAALGVHMATAHHMFVAIAQGRGVHPPDNSAWPTDLPAVRRLIDELTAADVAAMRALTDEALATRCKGVFDLVLPARTWLGSAREHEAHHKGQLMLYARMCGVEVPFFVKVG